MHRRLSSRSTYPLYLIALVLASCAPPATPEPSATAVPPQPTQAPTASATPRPPTATPAPTPTEITVTAVDDASYEDLVSHFGSWTRAQAEAAGYEVEPACIPQMGHHAIRYEIHLNNVVRTSEPSIVLVDGDGRVVGVEYVITDVVSDPPLVAGHPLTFTHPHPGMSRDHMSLHIYFVGSEADRFGETNPAVKC